MGYNTISNMLDWSTLDQGLEYHFLANCYPPIPLDMLPVAKQALTLASQSIWDARIILPHGVMYRGNTSATVDQVITGLHLEAFLDNLLATQEDTWELWEVYNNGKLASRIAWGTEDELRAIIERNQDSLPFVEGKYCLDTTTNINTYLDEDYMVQDDDDNY